VPFALMVAAYTGVLLSCTSNPLWCKNPWLSPLFAASAISTGAEALSLAMDLTHRNGEPESPSQQVLMHVDTAAHAAELACMTGFTEYAGEKANPLRHGAMKKHHTFSLGGIVVAELLKHLPVGTALRRPLRMIAATLGLAAGFSMRWSMVFAGHQAAADPHLSRVVSKPARTVTRRAPAPARAPSSRTMPVHSPTPIRVNA
jgi:formate-dependent nitrite reductase membrane component NrfD